jgi:hypothetical protein
MSVCVGSSSMFNDSVHSTDFVENQLLGYTRKNIFLLHVLTEGSHLSSFSSPLPLAASLLHSIRVSFMFHPLPPSTSHSPSITPILFPTWITRVGAQIQVTKFQIDAEKQGGSSIAKSGSYKALE